LAVDLFLKHFYIFFVLHCITLHKINIYFDYFTCEGKTVIEEQENIS